MITDSIAYNAAYISMNLLDELDYYLGGYAKPNFEFLFSLNTFVETFIASSTFYTSLDELQHLNLTTTALFPGGRPILNMVVREGGLRFVNGVVNSPGVEIFRTDILSRTKKQAQEEFILHYGTNIQQQYFIKSDITKHIDYIPLVAAKIEEDQFIVSEIKSQSTELIANLLTVSSTSSIQTSLPIYLYGEQITNLAKKPLSIQSLDKIAKIHDANLDELKKQLNYRYLPIPPFTNILLSQVSSASEIPQKLIQLRKDFQQLREQFVELEQEIYEAKNIKKQLEAYRRFEDYWQAFNRKHLDNRNRILYGTMDLTKGTDAEKSVEGFADGESLADAFKDLNLTKLAGNVIKKGIEAYKDHKLINRFKGLTNIWELFEEGKGINHQLKHIERLFSVKYDNREIDQVHQFVKSRIVNLTNHIQP